MIIASNPIKIAITGGKGGTGKSTMATALSSILSEDKKVLLIDADVDCPGDDLLLGIKLKKVEDVKNMMPVFDFKKCLHCGKCAAVCPEKAIVFVKGKDPIFIPEQCIGCRACKIVCPA
ncbi:MAG: 4Fe-4S binding protein, partial [Patescibacteria group bacterium]|nr:4Fe-4S binding protein [Patescibacteria group bacterium]